MIFNLPNKAFVNKFIAKSKFYEKANLNSKQQTEFANKILKITWLYKLSEGTIGISKTEKIEEIQIFDLELKERKIPKNIIKIIDFVIPYPILYRFIYKNDWVYAIALKDEKKLQEYYYSDWNKSINFEFYAINLEKVYQNIIKAFMPDNLRKLENFNQIITIDSKIQELNKLINILEKKIISEKQFNKKVELNKDLLKLKKEIENYKKDIG